MESNENPETSPANEESIFNENEFSMQGYDKHIKNARNALFIVAGVQLIAVLYSIFTTTGAVMWITAGITLAVALIFFLLGLWTKKKPFTAILIALIIYVGLWVADSIYDPAYIYKGILLKIIIIVYLVIGMRDAKEAQDMAKLHNS